MARITKKLEMRVAQRSRVYIKIGIAAPSGGGKTFSSLLYGYGMMHEKYPDLPEKDVWKKICLIDTENGSGDLEVGKVINNLEIGQYNIISIIKPYTVQKYLDALDMAEEYGIEFCIIDSSTHLWSGDGGLLEKHSEYAKKLGNSFTAWAKITPMHNKFVSRMLECDMHLIATMRSKQEYVTEKNNNGRTSVRKVGLEPQQRKGMEYEFTVFLEIDDEHKAFGSKDRTSLFDQKTFIITPDTGAETMAWLLSGKTLAPKVVMTKDETVARTNSDIKKEIIALLTDLGGRSNPALKPMVSVYADSGNPNAITKTEDLLELCEELNDMKVDMLAIKESPEPKVEPNKAEPKVEPKAEPKAEEEPVDDKK